MQVCCLLRLFRRESVNSGCSGSVTHRRLCRDGWVALACTGGPFRPLLMSFVLIFSARVNKRRCLCKHTMIMSAAGRDGR